MAEAKRRRGGSSCTLRYEPRLTIPDCRSETSNGFFCRKSVSSDSLQWSFAKTVTLFGTGEDETWVLQGEAPVFQRTAPYEINLVPLDRVCTGEHVLLGPEPNRNGCRPRH